MSFNLTLCEYAAYAMYYVHKDATIDEIAFVIRRYLGRDLILPDRSQYRLFGKSVPTPEAWEKPYKLMIYLGPEQCANGQEIFPEWKHLMDECKMLYPNLGFVFIAHTHDYKKLESHLSYAHIFHPVIYDRHNAYRLDNRFPDNHAFHVCLLDETNTILFVGSPVKNPQMWEEYVNVMKYHSLPDCNSRTEAG